MWSANHPRNFWLCQSDFSHEDWKKAIIEAFPLLSLTLNDLDVNSILKQTLGEARFGQDHWMLSLPKRVYYIVKPLLPRALTRLMRRIYQHSPKTDFGIQWPIEDRYVSFLLAVLAQLVPKSSNQNLIIKALWPDNQRFSFVLTHDVETKQGLEYVRNVANLEENLGFRSSFNFVPEGYRIDMNLVDELRQRGFEIGVHGLKHDGKLFSSRNEFERRAVRINQYLKEFGAVGFRSPLTHRNPEWIQLLNIEYDLSFFDTDPFEPIPGGTMSIWPFFLGHFVELPYTLVQDYTLTAVLGETSPRIWLEKVDFIEEYHGMALLNSHPDYLREPANMKIYSTFLSTMRDRGGYWHALPRDVAQWWRNRALKTSSGNFEKEAISTVTIVEGNIQIEPYKDLKVPESEPITNP